MCVSVLPAQRSGIQKFKTYSTFRVPNKKAQKNPLKVQRVVIRNYTDTVFPNDEIMQFKNAEVLVAHAGYRKSVTGDTLYAPVIRVDSLRLKNFTGLHKLKLDGFDFSRGFPEAICSLQQLTELTLAVCKIKALPPSIARLKELSYLECRVNELTELPDEFIALKNLQELDLGNNNFSLLPQVIAELPSLRTLNLANIEAFVFTPATTTLPFDLYVNQINFMVCYATVKRILTSEQFKRFEADIGICSEYLSFTYLLSKDQLSKKMILGEKGCKK